MKIGISFFGIILIATAFTAFGGCGTSNSTDAAAGNDGGLSEKDSGGGEDTGIAADTGLENDAGESDAGLDAGASDAGPADAGPAPTCVKGDTPVSASAVTVKDYSFSPDCIKVARGTKVTWTNTGMASHTVTSDTGAPVTFDSGALGAGGTFEFTFDAAGTVDYHCIPHESFGMKGTVIVE